MSFKLFRIMFSISAFTFGGGYIVIPMMRKHFIEDLNVLTESELLDIAAMAQSVPGAIAINISVLIGYKLNGIKGVIIALIASILPPLIILSIISKSYDLFIENEIILKALKGMEAAVGALIIELVVSMTQVLLKENSILIKLLAPLSFILILFTSINPIIIILTTVIVCLIQARVSA